MKLNIPSGVHKTVLAATLLTACEIQDPSQHTPTSITSDTLAAISNNATQPRKLEPQKNAQESSNYLAYSLVAITAILASLAALAYALSPRGKNSIATFKEKLKLSKEIKNLKKQLIKLQNELSDANDKHKEELKQTESKHKNEKEKIVEQHEREIERIVNRHKKDLENATNRIEQIKKNLYAEIDQLKGDLEKEKQVSAEKLNGMVDDSIVIEANETVRAMSEIANQFLGRIRILTGADSPSDNFFLIFSVEDDVNSLTKKVKEEIAHACDAWCNDDNPDKEANEQVLAPLVADLQELQRLTEARRYREALRLGYALMGKIDLLMNSTDNEVDDSQYENTETPLEGWINFVNDKRIPSEWLDEEQNIYDFFEVLDIQPITSWNTDFHDLARKAYHKKAGIAHPDKGGNTSEFKLTNEAWAIFQDEIQTTKYISSYEMFQTIFSKTRSYGKAA